MSVAAEKCLLLSAQMHSGLCTLIGIREKPGGREKANRGKEEREGEEGEEEKKKRKINRKKKDASGQYGCAFVPNNKKNSCLVGFLGY